MREDLTTLGIAATPALLRSRRISLRELVSAHLERAVDVADGTAAIEVIRLAEIAAKPQGGTTSPAPKL
ncbi:MAG: hypothetical protein ACRDF9_10545 [Candidatus Limnocylindria bacterium]